MFQDLHVVDFHAHFPIKGDVSTSGVGVRQYAAGTPAAEQAAYMRAQAERYRAAWRLAWDFPEPDPEATEQPLETVADRWLAELDRYGIDHIGFATGGGNDTLARAVARHPDRFIGFAHHNPFAPGAPSRPLRRLPRRLRQPARPRLRPRRPLPARRSASSTGSTSSSPNRIWSIVSFKIFKSRTRTSRSCTTARSRTSNTS